MLLVGRLLRTITNEFGVQARVPEECPQEVADLMLRCLDPDAAKRPTAKELVDRLMDMYLQSLAS